jgi:integrase
MALPESERVLTLVIAATGLRISEALGLQWHDVDYANQRINLRRVWVDNKVVAHEDRAVRSSRHDESHVGGGLKRKTQSIGQPANQQ